MIKKIEITNIATYRSKLVLEPKVINFVYGGNGTGKTTLSRLIADEKLSSDSKIEWNVPSHEKVVFYNRDFVEQNFSEDKELPGIFTLGSESIELQNEIVELKNKQDFLRGQRENEERTLSKLKGERDKLNADNKEKCWAVQVKHGEEFSEALIGYRASKEKFFEKCLDIYLEIKDSNDPAPEYESIKETYHAAYTKGAEQVNEYPILNLSKIGELDSIGLLSEIITGKFDTPIGAFIKFLDSGDWVKQGIEYAKKSNGKCPYCQRELPEDIAKEIADFFDEEYKNKCTLLSQYQSDYSNFISSIQAQLNHISSNRYSFLKYKDYDSLVEQFKTVSKSNLIVIQSKVETLSKQVVLSSLKNILEKIKAIIDGFNESIKKNNDIIANQDAAKRNCQSLIWLFFGEQLKDILCEYNKKLSGLERGIKQVESQIRSHEDNIKVFDKKIEEKETKLTSIVPTVNAINKILNDFGFNGFSLAENHNKPGTYIIIRPDGTDASRTLSEGEHNFISFLYFYYLCFGSQTSTGIRNDKIVVIDDPVSSLDSNVIFVIATLVKKIIQYCLSGEKGIKQVFVLTHNVYFHKEVTYCGSRRNSSQHKIAYYIIRKKDGKSHIELCKENPIKTSYEILWDELRNPNESSVKSVSNTMRRILEYYFQIIGGIKYEECINKFDGEDKLICKALIGFINEGSHSIFDDLIVSLDESSLENYLRVFKLIFERLHHIEHYNMMMKIDSRTGN